MSTILIKLGYCPSFDESQLTKQHIQETIAAIDYDLTAERDYLATRTTLNIGTIDAKLIQLSTNCIKELEQQRLELLQLAVHLLSLTN